MGKEEGLLDIIERLEREESWQKIIDSSNKWDDGEILNYIRDNFHPPTPIKCSCCGRDTISQFSYCNICDNDE